MVVKTVAAYYNPTPPLTPTHLPQKKQTNKTSDISKYQEATLVASGVKISVNVKLSAFVVVRLLKIRASDHDQRVSGSSEPEQIIRLIQIVIIFLLRNDEERYYRKILIRY